jgi:DNA-binding ferritin-like protein (Dps family)
MRTREEILELIKSDRINESKLSEEEFSSITGDDFETVADALKFLRANKEYEAKRVQRCERNMKRDLDL